MESAQTDCGQLDKIKEAIADDPTKSGYLRWDGKALPDYIVYQGKINVVYYRSCARRFGLEKRR